MTNDQVVPDLVPAPSPYASPDSPRPARATNLRDRRLLTLVTVGLGAYLTSFAFSGQIYSVFLGFNPSPFLGLYLVMQALIAVAVLCMGWAFAPTTPVRRILAIILTLVLVAVSFAIAMVRLSGLVRGAVGIPLQLTLGNVPFVIVVAVAIGWLIVRERSPLAYLFVLIAGALPFVQYALLLSGVESILSQLVLQVLSAVVLVAIAWMGRVVSGADAD